MNHYFIFLNSVLVLLLRFDDLFTSMTSHQLLSIFIITRQKLIKAAIQQVQMMVNTRGGTLLPTPAPAGGTWSQPQPPNAYSATQTNPLQYNPYPPPQHQYPTSPGFPPVNLPPGPHPYSAPSPQGISNATEGNPPQFIYPQGNPQPYGQMSHPQFQQGMGGQQQLLPQQHHSHSHQNLGQVPGSSGGVGTPSSAVNQPTIGDIGQVQIPQLNTLLDKSENVEQPPKAQNEDPEGTAQI